MNYSTTHLDTRPDKPLVVKCEFNNRSKKTQFKSARICTFDLLRERVQDGFSLSAQHFIIKWKDDDGEETHICTESDLTEAILYHQSADDPPASSSSSMFSYKSSSRNKITLNVQIRVDYDGPSLSDTSSLSSLEEYQGRNESNLSFSPNGPSPILDDDAVTVSSRDIGSRNSRPEPLLRKLLDASHSGTSSSQNRTQTQPRKSRSRLFRFSQTRSAGASTADRIDGDASLAGSRRTSPGSLGTNPDTRFTAEPTAVLAKLKLQERQNAQLAELPSLELRQAWLRDQGDRLIQTTRGGLPAPSDSDTFSLNTDTPFSDDREFNDISMERDDRGRVYYTYKSSSSEASREDGPEFDSFDAHVQAAALVRGPRPTSMGATSTESGENPSSGYPLSSTSQRFSIVHSASDPGPGIYEQDHDTNGIPPELLVPDEVTDCSECGTVLEQMRYICTTCGEKTALPREELEMLRLTGKGKGRGDLADSTTSGYEHLYPPHTHRSGPSSSSSSDTLQGLDIPLQKPLPALPSSSPTETTVTRKDSHPRSNSSSSSSSTLRPGYELCAMCIQSKGVDHSLLGGLGDGASPGLTDGPSSPQDLAVARRAAPKRKGQLRHAFAEKLWGSDGWQDLEKDSHSHHHCSGCQTPMHRDRYDCVVCENYALCRACFNDVHNIHPLHAFLVMPDQPTRSRSVPEIPTMSSSFDTAEESLKHPDVQCFHCGQDIVGALFHCVTCTKREVDICSNCDTAGLPGNLDAMEGEHSSSHLMLKIPMPLKMNEVQSVSHRVRMLASRDQANTRFHRSSPSSVSSSLARTVLTGRGSGMTPENHLVLCNSCGDSIVGSRFQCLSCPSKPTSYNLCSSCEIKSYRVHNPYHIFLELDRPVDNPKPLESETPLVRPLYKEPVGSTNGPGDPEAYLRDLNYSFALCDRHMTPINGRWYRCAYCAKDLCADCQALDTHDDTHAFLVFKAPVDLQQFRHFAELDRADGKSPPVLNDPVYYS